MKFINFDPADKTISCYFITVQLPWKCWLFCVGDDDDGRYDHANATAGWAEYLRDSDGMLGFRSPVVPTPDNPGPQPFGSIIIIRLERPFGYMKHPGILVLGKYVFFCWKIFALRALSPPWLGRDCWATNCSLVSLAPPCSARNTQRART